MNNLNLDPLETTEQLMANGVVGDSAVFFSRLQGLFWVRTVIEHGTHVEGWGPTLGEAFLAFAENVEKFEEGRHEK